MSLPACRSWREVPPATIAYGSTALEVETGLWRTSRPLVDADKCVSCLKCWLQCPDLSVLLNGENRVTGFDLFHCKGCGICANVCPAKAISLHSEADFLTAEGME